MNNGNGKQPWSVATNLVGTRILIVRVCVEREQGFLNEFCCHASRRWSRHDGSPRMSSAG